MPAMKPHETMDEFLSRCIPHVIKKEGIEQKHATAKCAGIYKQSKKETRRK